MEKKHLLILTYEMDESSQLFSHQVAVVNQLAKLFEEVTVLTGKIGYYKVDSNVKVYSSRWQNGKRIQSIINFLTIFLKCQIYKWMDFVCMTSLKKKKNIAAYL